MEGSLLFVKEIGALWKYVLLVQWFHINYFSGTNLKIAQQYNNLINKLKFFPKTSKSTIYTSE